MAKEQKPMPFGKAIEQAVRKDLERLQKDPTVPPRVKESLKDVKPPKL